MKLNKNIYVEIKKSRRKKVLKYLGNITLAIITFSVMNSPVSAIDSTELANQIIGSEGGQKATKEALNGALKIARSKPAMTAATGIVCISCIPVAGAATSPGLFIACGILIAKTFG